MFVFQFAQLDSFLQGTQQLAQVRYPAESVRAFISTACFCTFAVFLIVVYIACQVGCSINPVLSFWNKMALVALIFLERIPPLAGKVLI